MGPVATPGGNVAAVENTAPSPSRITGTRGARAEASNTAGSGRGPLYLAKAKALSVGLSNAYLQIAGTSVVIRGLLA